MADTPTPAKSQPVQMPDGHVVDIPDDATPEELQQLQQVQSALETQQKRGVGAGRVSPPSAVAQSVQAAGPLVTGRQKAQLVGGGVGGLTGLVLGGPQGAVHGAIGGSGLAGTGYDILTGDPNVNRDLLTTGITVMSQLHPAIRALPLASRLASAGIANTVAGATHDLATGNAAGPLDTVKRGVGDFVAGTFGAGTTEQAQDRATARAAEIGVTRDQSLRPLDARASLVRWGGEEGIPLSGADVSKSRTTAALERFPQSQLLGGQRVNDFRAQQMSRLDDAVNRHLGRLEARGASGNPTDVGTDIANSIDRINQSFTDSANQAYTHERNMLGDNRNFMPTNLRDKAREIMTNENRSPFTPDTAARRSADDALQTVETRPATPPTPGTPGVVIYDDQGNPITLGAIAGTPGRPAVRSEAPMDWVQGRRFLAQLGDKAYGKGDTPGEVSKTTVRRLHAALAQDMNEHAAAQGQDFVDFRNSVDDMYGQAKDAIRDRLRPITQAADQAGPEAAYGAMFRPGARGHTVALRDFLPRETFDRAAGTWLDQQVQKSTGASVGDRPVHSPAQLRAKLKPFIDSGQIDEMFPPEEADWIRNYYTHSPALGTSERLFGNPSGTGQTVEVASTLKRPFQIIGGLGTAGGVGGGLVGGAPGAAGGSALGATLGTAATTALPDAVSRVMMSPAGREYFAWQGRPTPDSIQRAFYNQLVAHGLKPPVERDQSKR